MDKTRLNTVQKKHYTKAMNALGLVFQYLCNANGALPSPEQQRKVSDLICKFKADIDKL